MRNKHSAARKSFAVAWKKIANARVTTRSDMLFKAVFDAVTGRPAKKDLIFVVTDKIHQVFSPETNPIKLANGWSPYKSVELAFNEVPSELLFDALSDHPDVLRTIEDVYLVLENHIQKLKNDGVDFYLPEPWYVYLFVDQSIPPIHQAIQLAHVSMKLGMQDYMMSDDPNDFSADNIHLVVVGVQENGYACIEDVACNLVEKANDQYVTFYESEFDMFTTLAVAPVNGIDRRAYRNLKLLSFPETALIVQERIAANDNTREPALV